MSAEWDVVSALVGEASGGAVDDAEGGGAVLVVEGEPVIAPVGHLLGGGVGGDGVEEGGGRLPDAQVGQSGVGDPVGDHADGP